MQNRIWFITGISSGLGFALAEVARNNGDFVIGTFINQQQTDTFNAMYGDKGLALTLDVTDTEAVQQAAKTIKNKFNRIDILVNNAGYGFAGAIEETSLTEAKAIFETNFFAPFEITKAFLPFFREQKSGHIIQISSHGGFKAFAGFGIYNASKFALEGFSEALAQEVDILGIKLTIVEPGPFRTNFADNSFRMANNIIDDYNATAGLFREKIKQANGHQEGDPRKAAHIIYAITQLDTPPLRLPLGTIALQSLQSKIQSVQNNIDEFKELALSAVYK
jgi:NAD(P)-dependent dehydrogenase (short-subunit alcohol dehydrogenase family)